MAGGDLSVEKEGDVQFRVKIISPLKAAEEDLARRQRRYAEHAREETTVRVINLDEGPPALNSSGDILESANAIFRQGVGTTAEEYDAILIDCVFDPAVKLPYHLCHRCAAGEANEQDGGEPPWRGSASP